jgi:hypothetical protein
MARAWPIPQQSTVQSAGCHACKNSTCQGPIRSNGVTEYLCHHTQSASKCHQHSYAASPEFSMGWLCGFLDPRRVGRNRPSASCGILKHSFVPILPTPTPPLTRPSISRALSGQKPLIKLEMLTCKGGDVKTPQRINTMVLSIFQLHLEADSSELYFDNQIISIHRRSLCCFALVLSAS